MPFRPKPQALQTQEAQKSDFSAFFSKAPSSMRAFVLNRMPAEIVISENAEFHTDTLFCCLKTIDSKRFSPSNALNHETQINLALPFCITRTGLW